MLIQVKAKLILGMDGLKELVQDSETGKAMQWCIEKAQLRLQMKPVSYLELELQACDLFGKTKPLAVKDAVK